jgi:hypothetical protein
MMGGCRGALRQVGALMRLMRYLVTERYFQPSCSWRASISSLERTNTLGMYVNLVTRTPVLGSDQSVYADVWPRKCDHPNECHFG